MRKRSTSLLLTALLASLLGSCVGPLAQTPEPLQKIRQQWQAAADDGNAQAQYYLGQSYCCGNSSGYSTRTALHWYCRAALQGYANAQFEMANILAGKQRDQSYSNAKSALMWYTAAAAQGNERALAERSNIASKLSTANVREARHWATRWTQAQCPW
ncbi:MAG TPA: sel1 repeat family protein [Gammaproteobacteria bacterium]|nr:sel1 repeat family protein [Gammaproteobacteria bacterium]